jgi:hypothetical protein
MKHTHRTTREFKFKRAVSKAITKSKATTRALSGLLSYDIPRGPKTPNSVSVWSSDVREIVFLLERHIVDGSPVSDHTKSTAARLAARLWKKLEAAR